MATTPNSGPARRLLNFPYEIVAQEWDGLCWMTVRSYRLAQQPQAEAWLVGR